MSEKRKDNKGRILKAGESQQENGRYIYQYKDVDGKRKMVYSWTLNATDKPPAGKKKGESLREKEKNIEKDLTNGYIAYSNITVAELAHEYADRYKSSVKLSSKRNYTRCYPAIDSSQIGKKKITSVNRKEAKDFIYGLLDNGMGFSTVLRIKNLLNSAYVQAVDDEIVSKNPFGFKLIKPVDVVTKKRDALPESDINEYLEFTSVGKRYKKIHHISVILLETGVRIGELLGLTLEDIDLKQGIMRVDHQLQYSGRKSTPNVRFYIETPKTQAGVRTILLSGKAKKSIEAILVLREELLKKLSNRGINEPIVDGYTNFLFISRNGNPEYDVTMRMAMHRACAAYKKKYGKDLPTITPHILRHTFCSRMVNGGMNPKSVQYIMGHSNIGMTLDVYSHVNAEIAISEMKKIINSDDFVS